MSAQALLDCGLEARPKVQIGDEQIAHDLLDVAIAVGERFDAVAERLDETRFVTLPIQTEGKRFLAGLDDFVGTENNDAGDQFDWNATLEQVDDQNAGGQELDATQ